MKLITKHNLENYLTNTDDPNLWESVLKDKWTTKDPNMRKYFILMGSEEAEDMDRSDWGNVKFLFRECSKEQKHMQEYFDEFQYFQAEIEGLKSFPQSSASNIRFFIREFLRFENHLHKFTNSYLDKAKSFIDMTPVEFIPEILLRSDEKGVFCKKEKLKCKKPTRISQFIRNKCHDNFSYIAIEKESKNKEVVTVEWGHEPFPKCGAGFRELWFNKKGKWEKTLSQQIWAS